MSKKIKDEEKDLFHQAVAGTKVLQQNKIRLNSSSKDTAVTDRHNETEANYYFNENADLPEIGSDESISYHHESISNKTLRKLRKGQYNVDAILDLHGMSVDEARIAVANFLDACLKEEIRVALIIHGKGRHKRIPVLKNKLNHWLRQTNTVLAFCSAGPTHGSRGALYILLKKMTS